MAGAYNVGRRARMPAARRKALLQRGIIDLDTTDVKVYGGRKDGVAFNHLGQHCGRPHVATWAEIGVALGANLLAGNEDLRRGAPALLRRALRALLAGVAQVTLRADAGYFAVDLAIAAHRAGVGLAIGAKRIAPLWRTLAGVAEAGWVDAIDMPLAQVAAAVEHWYRHRAEIENIFRDAKHGAALRHLPSRAGCNSSPPSPTLAESYSVWVSTTAKP